MQDNEDKIQQKNRKLSQVTGFGCNYSRVLQIKFNHLISLFQRPP